MLLYFLFQYLFFLSGFDFLVSYLQMLHNAVLVSVYKCMMFKTSSNVCFAFEGLFLPPMLFEKFNDAIFKFFATKENAKI